VGGDLDAASRRLLPHFAARIGTAAADVAVT
jgi:hypothetical protein